MSDAANFSRILAVDIGGSKSKAAIVDPRGKWLSERQRLRTPVRASPKELLPVLGELVKLLGAPFDVAGVGFPGVVRDGVTQNAPNLGKGWRGFPLGEHLTELFGCPCRIANDADVQGLAVIDGRGTELVLTLGTGLGSALFRDGVLLPNTEFGHLPYKDRESFEHWLGNDALQRRGQQAWEKDVLKTLEILQEATGCDLLHLGGGNSRILANRHDLPEWVRLVENSAGITGAALLWRLQRHV